MSKRQKEKVKGIIKKKSLFDNVKHIRQVKDPDYYKNLSEEERKTFNHYMILRALSMDSSIIEEVVELFKIFDKVPSEQFYQLLISIVPTSTKFYPWIKSKTLKHNKKLLGYVADRFKVSKNQANDYINILLRSEYGQIELVNILKAQGLEDKEIEKIFEEKENE